ncbi:MAG: class Ib ribonucleoside-diphosphate reductase assembly flavoprotein NrdI, partial [Microbacterium sp.]
MPVTQSPGLVFFSSVSENTRRFVERLDRSAARIPLRPRVEGLIRVARPFVLVVPTYGGGERAGAVPKQVISFL